MKFTELTALAYLTFILLATIGWVMNLLQVINSSETLATMPLKGILQIVGIFVAPLGAAIGWLS